MKVNRPKLHVFVADMRDRAHAEGRHDAQRIAEIAKAALEYGDSSHTGDANCSAGDCDHCSARTALQRLEALVGGPRRPQ